MLAAATAGGAPLVDATRAIGRSPLAIMATTSAGEYLTGAARKGCAATRNWRVSAFWSAGRGDASTAASRPPSNNDVAGSTDRKRRWAGRNAAAGALRHMGWVCVIVGARV